jgi:hypothetical protein
MLENDLGHIVHLCLAMSFCTVPCSPAHTWGGGGRANSIGETLSPQYISTPMSQSLKQVHLLGSHTGGPGVTLQVTLWRYKAIQFVPGHSGGLTAGQPVFLQQLIHPSATLWVPHVPRLRPHSLTTATALSQYPFRDMSQNLLSGSWLWPTRLSCLLCGQRNTSGQG